MTERKVHMFESMESNISPGGRWITTWEHALCGASARTMASGEILTTVNPHLVTCESCKKQLEKEK